jgi:type I restriction enzyme M protein
LATSSNSLDVSTLEGWLWDAACQVHRSLDVPKFRDYILPLIFLKRLIRRVSYAR